MGCTFSVLAVITVVIVGVIYVIFTRLPKSSKKTLFKLIHGSKMKQFSNTPGPTPVFPMGSVGKLLGSDVPWVAASRISAKYNSGIILIWVMGEPAFLINSTSLLKEVLQDKDIKCFNKEVKHLGPMLGPNDPFCANGDEYHKLRELHPFMRPNWREIWLPSQTASIRKLVFINLSKMAMASKEKPIKLMWLCQRMMFDTFSQSLLGTTLGDEAHEEYHFIGEIGDIRIHSPLQQKFPPWQPKYHSTMKSWYARFQKFIDASYANPEPTPGATDLINFLKKERAEKKYSPDEVGETLHGGVYSVGSAIVSVIHCLAKDHLRVQKLKEELNKYIGAKLDSFTYDELQKCEYLECVLREALRLLPPVSFYSRKANKDGVTVNGVELKKGSTVMISTWDTHHDGTFWTDPFLFNPERWQVDEDFLKNNTYGSDHFCPFGRGLRQCMGYPYGLLNIKISVAAFVLTTNFSTDPNTWKDNFFFGINMPYSLRGRVTLNEKFPSQL